MRDVVCFAPLSGDGFMAAANGDSDRLVRDPESHRHFNALENSNDAHLYGRRMDELMAVYLPNAQQRPCAPRLTLVARRTEAVGRGDSYVDSYANRP